METDKSMISTKDLSRQNRIGSSGRSLQELEAYLTRGRRLQAECMAELVRASGFKLIVGCLRITTTLAKAGTKIWGAVEILYYYFFRPGEINVICKSEQR